ncbi:MAG: electron transfer flavoprotein subunit alpha/FixB family protein, partial [Bacteroidetes bacterium]|nr:electron transfer flavoprotein subunit alpha/FixB family protein [Bacteroidota bacterium]
MNNNIFVIAEHLKGKVDDTTYEMLGKAKELAGSYGGEVVAVLLGNGVKDLATDFSADKVLYADHPELANFNPEAYNKTIAALVESHTPKVIMVAYSSQGFDIAAALSVDFNLPLLTYVSEISSDGITSNLYGGKMNVESQTEGDRFVVSVLPGAFPADAGKGSGAIIEDVAAPDLEGLKIQFKQLIEPEEGDVDISKHNILVSVGRGIQNEDNLEIVQELADKLNAALCSSRPIVDNKWLPKTRQVGKSGLK